VDTAHQPSLISIERTTILLPFTHLVLKLRLCIDSMLYAEQCRVGTRCNRNSENLGCRRSGVAKNTCDVNEQSRVDKILGKVKKIGCPKKKTKEHEQVNYWC
jgi:hypothetical protein